MPRPKGSKNRKKTEISIESQFAALTAQKRELEAAQAAIIASIAEDNAKLKANKKEIRAVERKLRKLEAQRAEADAAASAARMQQEVMKRLSELTAEGMSLEEILEKLK